MITKTCPACPPDRGPQPIENFGVVAARPDGRNLYCKVCIRRKVTEGRQRKREFKRARAMAQGLLFERRTPLPDRMPMVRATGQPLSNTDKVLKAIDEGARTQRDIKNYTRWPTLTSDEVSDALAELMLDTREVEAHYSPALDQNIYMRRRREVRRIA